MDPSKAIPIAKVRSNPKKTVHGFDPVIPEIQADQPVKPVEKVPEKVDSLKLGKLSQSTEIQASELFTNKSNSKFMVGSPGRPSFEDRLFLESHNAKKQSEKVEQSENQGDKPPMPERKSQKQMTKAERRELQERQRAEKAARIAAGGPAKEKPQPKKISSRSSTQSDLHHPNMKSRNSKQSISLINLKLEKSSLLLSHLPFFEKDYKLIAEAKQQGLIHPSVLTLGRYIMERKITGGNARCMAMLLTFKKVILDYSTPPGVSLSRDLTQYISRQVDFLAKTRSLAASMRTAVRYLKTQVSNISIDLPDADAKAQLCEKIEDFIKERILIADDCIYNAILNGGKIRDGDVIMVYAKSSVILGLLKEAYKRGISFRVVIVDSRPWFEGKGMLTELTSLGIKCTYIMTHAIPYLIKEVTKAIVGASSIMANGDVMARAGTAVVCMSAYDAKIPVLALCESYKFADNLIRLDSFVWNELGDPDQLASETLKDWKNIDPLILVNLCYDLTPAKFISAVVCEQGLIPSDLVQVVSHQEQ